MQSSTMNKIGLIAGQTDAGRGAREERGGHNLCKISTCADGVEFDWAWKHGGEVGQQLEAWFHIKT